MIGETAIPGKHLPFWLSVGYPMGMSHHSVAEAKNQLSRLIDAALNGETIVITRHGHPVVELRPVSAAPKATGAEMVAWLDAHRIPLRDNTVDAVALVRQVRDEEWD